MRLSLYLNDALLENNYLYIFAYLSLQKHWASKSTKIDSLRVSELTMRACHCISYINFENHSLRILHAEIPLCRASH